MRLENATFPPGEPSRRHPLPLEFAGVHYIDEQELETVARGTGAPAVLSLARENWLFLPEDCAQCAGGSPDELDIIAAFGKVLPENL